MSEITLTNRSIRFITEAEAKRTLADKDQKVAEWETVGYTFVRSDRELVILRAGALGGDVREVHGGWKYNNVFSLMLDWSEILHAAEPYKRKAIF